MSRRRKPLPETPFEADISDLSHDGRGVATVDGKKVFIAGALPGERVRAVLSGRQRRYDEAETCEVLKPSPDRVEPPCPHFGRCGGCALQHLSPAAQLAAKQESLLQSLARIGRVSPPTVLKPLQGPVWHYRRKARLSVRRVTAKQRVLVGFRERRGRYVADMDSCEVLDERAARMLPRLAPLIESLSAAERVPQVEVACGERVTALVFRHLDALGDADRAILRNFARDNGVAVLLQPGGPDSIEALEPGAVRLEYDLPAYDLKLAFEPSDFVQVNAELNRLMIDHALELLDPQPADRVLDLFCGLGNFTLPLARRCAEVVGVEGDSGLVRRARANAADNGIRNAQFHAADLCADPSGMPWLRTPYDKVLLDPPRSGAEVILPHVAASGASRLVYVSCHPASLARDAGILEADFGYRLQAAGVMDMFPHTGHVESIALFERA